VRQSDGSWPRCGADSIHSVSAFTGEQVPPLPVSLISNLFGSFASPAAGAGASSGLAGGSKKIKVEKAALDAVDDA